MIDVRFIVLAARPRITRDDKVSDIALSDSAWSATKEIMDRLQHTHRLPTMTRFILFSTRMKRTSIIFLWQGTSRAMKRSNP